MIIGVTGTRKGAAPQQFSALTMAIILADEIHHGACIGVDAQAHTIGGRHDKRIVVHPPINTSKMMLQRRTTAQTWLEPREYLQRDRDIVDSVRLLIAVPETSLPQQHSGTWYAINYARQQHIPTVIIRPERVDYYDWKDGSSAWIIGH